MNDFRGLDVWKEARDFRNKINTLTKSFPNEEKFLLTNQLIRCSRSVTANISEGHRRFHYQENIQFCRQVRGSLTETLDHLICAFDNKYIDESTFNKMEVQYTLILKLLNGYIAYLKKRKEED